MKLRRPFRSGFSLIEVTIALGIATFCLVALFALLPMGLNQNRDTIEQTVATSIAANIAADIRASLQAQLEYKKNPTGVTNPNGKSVNYQIPLPIDATGKPITSAQDPAWDKTKGDQTYFTEGQELTAQLSDARYNASVSYFPDGTNLQSVSARIVVGWPAAVDLTKANKVDVVTAFVAP
jgi:uncharacterized protein (TIGR02598 family)